VNDSLSPPYRIASSSSIQSVIYKGPKTLVKMVILCHLVSSNNNDLDAHTMFINKPHFNTYTLG